MLLCSKFLYAFNVVIVIFNIIFNVIFHILMLLAVRIQMQFGLFNLGIEKI